MPENDRKLVSFDWAIKRLLRSKANFEVLEGFLSELLYKDVKILQVLESESNQEDGGDKYNRVDVKVEDSTGEIIIIEVQFNDELDFMHRILYSASKTICEHMRLGESFSKVVKVISVNILYFNLGEGDDYIYKGTTTFNGMHNNSVLKLNEEQRRTFNKEYPSEIYPEFYIIKVDNFNDIATSTLDQWVYLLKNSAVKPGFKAKGIEKANEVLDIMKMTKEERLSYEHFMENMAIGRSWERTAEIKGEMRGISIGREEGIAIGREEGIAIGKLEAMKNMIGLLSEMGMKKDAIKEKIKLKFDLSEDEIKLIL